MHSNPLLKKKLSLFNLLVFGIGIIIGAGVYAVLGAAAGHAGNSLWLSFLFAAIVAFLTAFSYCELATLFPTAGAEYIYLRKTYPAHRLPSFLLGFFLILAGAATAATVAVGFGGYLQHFTDFPKTLAALILLLLVTIINSAGIQNSSRINLVFTALEVAGLIIFIWLGWTTEAKATPNWRISAGTLTATSLIFFVYLGFEDIANLAEETKDPNKNIPRAFIWSLVITTILYVAVALAATRLAAPELLAKSDSPLAEAIQETAPRWVNVLSAIALFSTANTVLVTMLAIARMIYGVAKEGDLPKFLSNTMGAGENPILASIASLMCAASFLLLGDLEILANVSSFAALLGFLTVNGVLIILRYKKPDLKRPFKTPLNIGKFPLMPSLGIIAILILCTQFNTVVYVIGIGMITVGTILFFLTKHLRKA